MILNKILPGTLLLMSSLQVAAQNIGIGQWQIHLPYRNTIEVKDAGTRMYCATENAVFYHDLEDNSLNRMSKVSGLSDVGVSAISYRPSGDVLVIGYSNANIDLIKNGSIFNISDIKRKSILGNKDINTITFINNIAYLACGFGIVLLDVDKNEILDTYYVSVAQDEVNQVIMLNDTLYAAASTGLYKAPLSSINLSDFNSWTRETAIPAGVYNCISTDGVNLYLNRSINPTDILHNDTIYKMSNAGWSYFDTTLNLTVSRIECMHDKILISASAEVFKYDLNDNLEFTYSKPVAPIHSIISSNGEVWIADNYAGLIKENEPWGIYPDGPATEKVFSMSFGENDLWIAPGGRTGSWDNSNISDGIFNYIANQWTTITYETLDSIQDFTEILVDPKDNNRVFAGSWNSGVVEIYKSKIENVFNEANTDSALQSVLPGKKMIRVGGLALDENSNLWVSCTEVYNLLSVKEVGGNWFSFQFSGFGLNTRVSDVLVDQQDNVWILLPGNGIIVLDHNGTLDNKNDDQEMRLVNAVGSGNLPNKEVICMAMDHDGEIWVGTNEGIAVFYSPELIFSNSDFDAQQILVEQDGYFQYLLETEIVNAISIDGANRKWIATESAGVFLMSEDGTEQLYHFTEKNSPLLSDNIISIAINHKNGEVFFGTDKGIISYKSTATERLTENTNVYAYPNPVREGYNGIIAIKGLVADADVKITDISGALIYQTKALGGQAIWDGKNFNGEKAHTGIYMVFASNEDGTQTVVTKILFIN